MASEYDAHNTSRRWHDAVTWGKIYHIAGFSGAYSIAFMSSEVNRGLALVAVTLILSFYMAARHIEHRHKAKDDALRQAYAVHEQLLAAEEKDRQRWIDDEWNKLVLQLKNDAP